VLTKNIELVVTDIRDQQSMTSLFRGVDVVFHLACLGVRHSLHSPMANQEVNATGPLGL
jgi:UDP-glucose 4-epimerase